MATLQSGRSLAWEGACLGGRLLGRSKPGASQLAAALLLLAGFVLPHAAGQLTDRPLVLPGRPGVARAAAAAGPPPDERAGYFDIPDTKRKLFYWFYQARDISTGAAIASAPLIVWLNGGPGCSSLFGMFFENGPYTLAGDLNNLQLVTNNYTWAAAGHMLYIDQPIGTGLSYSDGKKDVTSSMLDVSKTMVAFMQAFYAAPQYSQLVKSRLFLAGESFAGHYLPAIGAYMKLTAPSMPLAGVAMGNPCTNAPAMYESYLTYALSRSLITPASYASLSASLESCKLQAAVCNSLDEASCEAATSYCETQIYFGVVLGTDPQTGLDSEMQGKNPYNIKAPCDTSSDCYYEKDSRMERYVNDNRAALGVPSSVKYLACGDSPYWALLHDMAKSYEPLVAALLDNNVPVMVYSGTDDFVCNWMSSRQWVDGLIWSRSQLWPKTKTSLWAGGSVKRLGPLSFARVAKAGHMVPMDQPALSLQLIRQWMATGQPAALRAK